MTAPVMMRVRFDGPQTLVLGGEGDTLPTTQLPLDATPARVCEAVRPFAQDHGRPVRVEVEDVSGAPAWAVTVHPDGSTVDLVLAPHPQTAGAVPGPRKKGTAPAPNQPRGRLVAATAAAAGLIAATLLVVAVTMDGDSSAAPTPRANAATSPTPTPTVTTPASPSTASADPTWRAKPRGGPRTVELRVTAAAVAPELLARVSLWRDGLPQHSALVDLTTGEDVVKMRRVAPGVWVWRVTALKSELHELTGRVLVLPRESSRR